MSDDYDDYSDDYCDETPCPRCGEWEVHSRPCESIGCDDGWCDEHDDDPVNFGPGEEFTMCRECFGTGFVRWCRKCGCDLNFEEFKKRQSKP